MWAINKNKHGFTVVELLIVIVVIGILATLTIISYNGVPNQAYDASVKNDLANMAKKLSVAALKNSETFPLPPAVSTDIHISKNAYLTTSNNLYYCYNSSTNQYAVAARSRSGKQFKILDGIVSEHGSTLYGADTCALLGLGTWTGNGSLGFDFSITSWANWAL